MYTLVLLGISHIHDLRNVFVLRVYAPFVSLFDFRVSCWLLGGDVSFFLVSRVRGSARCLFAAAFVFCSRRKQFLRAFNVGRGCFVFWPWRTGDVSPFWLFRAMRPYIHSEFLPWAFSLVSPTPN